MQKVQEQISSMTRLRDALEFIASNSELKKGVLQVGAGVARGAVTFEDGFVISARLTTGSLFARKALEEMLRMDDVKLQLMPFMPARKNEQVWVNLRHLIANEWSLDGLVTDRPPSAGEEQQEFVKVEKAPEQSDVSTMVEAAFTGEELTQLRAQLQESIKPTEEVAKPELVSATKATIEIPMVMVEQAMMEQEPDIASSDDAFFDMEPKEAEVPPMTVPSAFRDEPEPAVEPEPEAQPEPVPAVAATPEPPSFPAIDFGMDETETNLPAVQPAVAAEPEPTTPEPEPTVPEPEPPAPEPEPPAPEYVEPEWPVELTQAPPTFDYPVIDFDAPDEEEPVPPPVVPEIQPEPPVIVPEPEPPVIVPEPEPVPLVPEPQPQPLVPEPVAPPIPEPIAPPVIPEPIAPAPIPQPLRPTAAGYFEPPLHAHSAPVAPSSQPAVAQMAPPVEPEISDAERWMRAQKAMSAPIEQQREQFEQTNQAFQQTGFSPFPNATPISREAEQARPFDKSELDSIRTPEVEDADYQPLIAMPEDGPGDAGRRADKGIIDRAPTQTGQQMPDFKRIIRRNLRQPERILTPIVFGSLILGIFILPGQIRKSMTAENNEQFADTQVEMTIAEETKQEVPYASVETNRPPVTAAPVANAGTGIASNSSSDDPGGTVVLRDDGALAQARRLSSGHKWNRIAYVMYREYLKRHPKDFDVRIECIKYLMEAKQTKEAKQECIEALTSGPSVEQSGALSALYKHVQLMPMN